MKRIHPFRLVVREELTLTDIARNNDTTVNDLFRVNPELAHTSALAWLEHGSIIQLPPTLHLRGRPFGDAFVVQEAVGRIERVTEQWKHALEERKKSATDQDRLPIPPVPRVRPKTDQFDDVVVQEVVRQKPAIVALAKNLKDEDALCSASIVNALDTGPLLQRFKVINDIFHVQSGLEALKPEHTAVMQVPPLVGRQNVLSSTTEQTVPDATLCDCSTHPAELHFSFIEANKSRDIAEKWAVLPCQPLTVLVDALKCKLALLPYPHTKNSMLFICGAFFIDDRHEGYEDLSEVIREGIPSNTAYRDCKVYSMSKTTFGELTVKFHEYCLFRHLGNFDHYFFLDDIVPLVGGGVLRRVPVARKMFPRRVFLAAQKELSCHICQQLPATILTWGDRLAPRSPFLMCRPCFRLFHVNAKGEEVNDGYVKFELPAGEHF